MVARYQIYVSNYDANNILIDNFKIADEIVLTNGDEFKKFPRTPQPYVMLDGVFITQKDRKQNELINKLNQQYNEWNINNLKNGN